VIAKKKNRIRRGISLPDRYSLALKGGIFISPSLPPYRERGDLRDYIFLRT